MSSIQLWMGFATITLRCEDGMLVWDTPPLLPHPPELFDQSHSYSLSLQSSFLGWPSRKDGTCRLGNYSQLVVFWLFALLMPLCGILNFTGSKLSSNPTSVMSPRHEHLPTHPLRLQSFDTSAIQHSRRYPRLLLLPTAASSGGPTFAKAVLSILPHTQQLDMFVHIDGIDR